jgi:radical SAM enzyme (TIGR01210 family)
VIRAFSSIYPETNRTSWIVGQRPARGAEPDWYRPQAVFLEREPLASGEVVDSGVVLLTNRECPWKCLMCDLWQHTTTQSVPLGAIPRQIDEAVRTWSEADRVPVQVKLYNSGSFFDPGAIPPDDYAAIAECVAFARNVVVESHPLLVGERTLRLRDLLSGTLEVAIGLETAHPQVLEKLNKKFTLEQFSRAANLLAQHGVALRVFLLVHPPFLSGGIGDSSEARQWLRKSVDFAFECRASAVSLIPTRLGNGAMDRLRQAGEFAPPTRAEVDAAAELARAAAGGRGRVFVDTWGIEGP